MNVSGKYLKDESGTIFSPVVTFDTIYSLSYNQLTDCIYGTLLFKGNNLGNLTLTDSCDNYGKILIEYEYSGVTGFVYMEDINNKEICLTLGVTFVQYNLCRFHYKTLRFNYKKVTVAKSGYFGLTDSGTTDCKSQEPNGIYIIRIIGYKN